MKARQRRLADLRAQVPEIEPRDAAARQQAGDATLIDVREPDEVAAGSPQGALRLGRGFLELRIEDEVPDFDRPLLVMCAGGSRSLFAGRALQELGYTDVHSVRGGFNAWKQQALDFEVPRVLSDEERARYGRHLRMPEIGEAGQARLLDSRVLLIGAGGLGSPAALYLAAAGVGTIGLIDDDVVDRSNLQRQILHTDARVCEPKVESARATLRALNPSVTVETYAARLTADNVDELFPRYDVVIDGTDNFTTRYLVNDACVRHGVPNVHGSIFRFDGQVSVFDPSREIPAKDGGTEPAPCYRCVYPEPPPAELAPSCAEAGVLGVLPGVIGVLEAIEAIKLLLDLGTTLAGRLLVYDALDQRFTELKIRRDPCCPTCGDDARAARAAGVAVAQYDVAGGPLCADDAVAVESETAIAAASADA
ncbi:MAG: molybdopterin-synthase adenylyltransferase MoeB [Acidobacteriota bacterium]